MKKLFLAVMVASLVGCGGDDGYNYDEDMKDNPPIGTYPPEIPTPPPTPEPEPEEPEEETRPDFGIDRPFPGTGIERPTPQPPIDEGFDQGHLPDFGNGEGNDIGGIDRPYPGTGEGSIDRPYPEGAMLGYVNDRHPYYMERVFQSDFVETENTFPVQLDMVTEYFESPMGVSVSFSGKKFIPHYNGNGYQTEPTKITYTFSRVSIRGHGAMGITKEFFNKIKGENPVISMENVVQNPDGTMRVNQARLHIPFNGPVELIDENRIRLLGITYKAGFIDSQLSNGSYGTGFWDEKNKVMNVYGGYGGGADGTLNTVTVKEVLSENTFTYQDDNGDVEVVMKEPPMYPMIPIDYISTTETLKPGSVVWLKGSTFDNRASVYKIK